MAHTRNPISKSVPACCNTQVPTRETYNIHCLNEITSEELPPRRRTLRDERLILSYRDYNTAKT